MTPARKKALEWFADNDGVDAWDIIVRPIEGAPSPDTYDGLVSQGYIVRDDCSDECFLTDAGRRALNGDSK